MNNIGELKKIIDTLKINNDIKSKLEGIVKSIDMELGELKFATKRYQDDQRVNKNFVKKTVSLLELSNENLKKSNNQLLKANSYLIKSNEELERFTYIASHDLQTPLQNILNFSGLLKSKLQTINNPDITDYLNLIIDGGKRMKNLIEAILEYSKINNKHSDYKQSFNLSTIIGEISLSISEYLNTKNAKIEILSPLPNLSGNRFKFFILFKNLIENGIKYNKSTTPVIKIYSKTTAESHYIYVKDNGIGIEKKYHNKIFQMFTRLHNHNDYEGVGIGLSMCKKIVEGYNGKIDVESLQGKQTLFIIELPIG